MMVVRGRLLAVPSLHEADQQTGRPAYLGVLIGEETPARADEVTTVVARFTGASAMILHAQRFRAGDRVTVTGRMGEPEAMIDGFARAYAIQTIVGETMQIDPIGTVHARDVARERELEREADLYDTVRDAWCDPLRGEYIGDGVSRTLSGEPFSPLSGVKESEQLPWDPADPDLIAAQSMISRGLVM